MASVDATQNEQRLKSLKLGSKITAPTTLRVYNAAEVKQHVSEKDCWMIIHGLVYNVTNFLEDHPGGPEILQQNAGTDATQEFEQVFHSAQARQQLADYLVGILDTYDGPLNAAVVSNSQPSGSSSTEATSNSSESSGGFGGLLTKVGIPLFVLVLAFVLFQQSNNV